MADRAKYVDGNALVVYTQQVKAALNEKAPTRSPELTGRPTAPTVATTDNSALIATTQFVHAAVDAGLAGMSGTLKFIDAVADLGALNALTGQDVGNVYVVLDDGTGVHNVQYVWTQSNTWKRLGATVDLSIYATLASPTFTGTPTAPTPNDTSPTNQVVTKDYADAIDAKADAAQAAIDVLNGDDTETGSVAKTVADAIADAGIPSTAVITAMQRNISSNTEAIQTLNDPDDETEGSIANFIKNGTTNLQKKSLTTPLIVDDPDNPATTVEAALTQLNSKSVTVDDDFSSTSTNPLQNKIITQRLDKAAFSVVELPAASATMANMVRFNLDDNKWYVCDGAQWKAVTQDVDLSAYKKQFNGTLSEWNALSEEEQDEYESAAVDDMAGTGSMLTGTVEEGNENAVTSDAVYERLVKTTSVQLTIDETARAFLILKKIGNTVFGQISANTSTALSITSGKTFFDIPAGYRASSEVRFNVASRTSGEWAIFRYNANHLEVDSGSSTLHVPSANFSYIADA